MFLVQESSVMTKNIQTTQDIDSLERPRLRGSVGVWGLVFMVLAGAAPLGVVGGTVPIGISLGNGAGLPAILLVATVLLLLFSAGFTALAPHVQNAGAFYTYIGKGLGRKTGFGFAFVALIGYLSLCVGMYALLASGAVGLFQSWGISLDWSVFALVSLAIVAYLGHRNINLSMRVLGVLLVAEILIVLVFNAAVLLRGGGPDGMSTGFLQPSTVISGAPGIALLFAFLMFLGFEATAVFRDEVRNPNRTVPRATYIAVTLVGLFYVVSSWALISAFGDDAAVSAASDSPETMLPKAVLMYVGTVAEQIVQILFVTSMLACALTFQNVVARYMFTMSNRGALPRMLGNPHSRHASPHIASGVASLVILVFIVGTALLGLDPALQVYAWFAGYTTVAFILLLMATTISVLIFFVRRRRLGILEYSIGRVFVAPAIALVGLLFVTYLVIQNLPDLVGGSTFVAVAILVFLVTTFAAGFILAWRRKDLTLE